MPGENYQKWVKDASNVASFYSTAIDEIIKVKQIGFVLARTITEYQKFINMSSDFNFTVTS
mgnify:CR=1 FL=1